MFALFVVLAVAYYYVMSHAWRVMKRIKKLSGVGRV